MVDNGDQMFTLQLSSFWM